MSGAFYATAVLVAISLFLAADDVRMGSPFRLAAHAMFAGLFAVLYLLTSEH